MMQGNSETRAYAGLQIAADIAADNCSLSHNRPLLSSHSVLDSLCIRQVSFGF